MEISPTYADKLIYLYDHISWLQSNEPGIFTKIVNIGPNDALLAIVPFQDQVIEGWKF